MKKITMNETTKKIIRICVCVVLIVGVLASSFMGGYYLHKETTNEYTINATVVEIIEEDTTDVYFETETGHIFYITTDEVFAVFEEYTITFDTNNTPTFDDDIITKVGREIIVLAE